MLKTLSFTILLVTSHTIFSQNSNIKPDSKIPLNTKPLSKRKVIFSELQNINEVYFFKGVPYTGISFETFDGRIKMQEMEWVNGLLHGTKTEWFKGGSIIRAKMRFSEGKRNGVFENYYSNGKPKLIGKYVNDVLDSLLTAFYLSGVLQYTFTYANGEKTGEAKTYYQNGNLEQSVYLINGYPNGNMKTYYEAGNIRLETTYINGIKDGKYLRYHLTGLVAEESYYKNGVQDSISLYWDNVFGNKLKQEHYKMGIKEGVWITFNELGDTLTIFNYKNNVYDGEFKKYFCGDVEIGDKMNGKLSTFDRTKSIKKYIYALDEYGTYVNGKLNGQFKTGLYHREAHAEGVFDDGNKIGEWRYFDENDKLVLFEKYNELGELIEQKPQLQPLKGE